MANETLIRTLAIATAVAALFVSAQPVSAADERTPVISVTTSDAGARPVSLGIGKAVIIDLPRDAKDVLVADPTIANAVVRSSRRAYMIGVKVGQTSIFFFDGEGRQIAGFDIAVKRDLNGIREAILRALPYADIRVEALGPDGIVLSGSVSTPVEAQTAFAIAARVVNQGTATLAQSGDRIVNAITVREREQVNLRVTVAEVQRDVIKQLGVDLNGTVGVGSAVLNFNNENPFPVYGTPLMDNNRVTGTFTQNGRSINATLRAMERAGVIRTLAEPNLTAISGEAASFLAGGEFPIVAGVSCQTIGNCTPTIQFKKFGISLAFNPVVLSEGRISLKVTTEVSELSTEGAIVNSGFTIPSLKVRRADTTVEIPSGGSLALAGMIAEQTKQQINGLPGLMQLPVLGALFKSRDYINRQSELMILVTPYIVRPVAQKDLSRPDDGFADASDPSTVFLGRLNRLYGIPGKIDPNTMYRGKYGFILD
ncbi:MAG: type II and III secretion system protein family protein [Pseudorhodoplanes sp.]